MESNKDESSGDVGKDSVKHWRWSKATGLE